MQTEKQMCLKVTGTRPMERGFLNDLYLNTYTSTTSYGWSYASFAGVIPQFFVSHPGGSVSVTSGILGDVNGDGLPDYEQASEPSARVLQTVHI